MTSLPPAIEGPTTDERNWAAAAHIASLANLVFPFGAVLGPLVVWLTKKDTSRFVDHHGRESLQFQICFLAYHMIFVCGGVGSFIAALVVADTSKSLDDVMGPLAVAALIGLVGIALLLRIFVTITMIYAATRTSAGELFRYPFTIRLMGSPD